MMAMIFTMISIWSGIGVNEKNEAENLPAEIKIPTFVESEFEGVIDRVSNVIEDLISNSGIDHFFFLLSDS